MTNADDPKALPPALMIAADIVSAYVGQNSIPSSEVSSFLKSIYDGITAIANGTTEPLPADPLVPAVAIKKSVTNDYIISLEDGKKFKSLKRHLSASYGMTPDEYRAKWGLPHDYPMVAPGYAATRSALAKEIGLGRKTADASAPKAVKPKGPAKKRGRPAKAD